MRYQIIARRTSPSHSDDYRHIVEVQYRVGSDIQACTREQMVHRLSRGHTAYVEGENQHSEVGVFDLYRPKALRKAKYLRSYSYDDFWNESLSHLPTF
jgi:hypothetical protein